ncbi:MAG TPA: XdhC family protein [Candidatus Dormibacteraeota bacterium]|jgi:xanthine/CO dehydrogenase XdhC/CoxF family maturation factor|nr:XdhC family protein [Candidatus Dormibacteraeota bacterium]
MSDPGGADVSCAVAHGADAPTFPDRTLVAVFASPVSRHLIRYGRDLGFRTILVEPDVDRLGDIGADAPDEFRTGVDGLDGSADVILTDHHRDELGALLHEALAGEARWIGIMGNPRFEGPHVAMLRALGDDDATIARVHRPIGLNIGSRTPPEIAVAVLAGLLADRNGRAGGLEFGLNPAPAGGLPAR